MATMVEWHNEVVNQHGKNIHVLTPRQFLHKCATCINDNWLTGNVK